MLLAIHVAANGNLSLFFLVQEYLTEVRIVLNSIDYVYHVFFTHSSGDGHLDCFHISAI